MVSRRSTLADVAKAADVSRTTVSVVLNGRVAGIPIDTRERVFNAARQLSYWPHAAAQALRSGRANRIGIVLSHLENYVAGDAYFNEIMAGVTSAALRHKQDLLLHFVHYSDWSAQCAHILGGGSDGVLLVASFACDQLTPELLNSGFPIVCLSYHLTDPRCVSVDCSNEEGGYIAARHLIELGHEHLSLIYPGSETSWGAERLKGVLHAIADAGGSPERLKEFTWSHTDAPSPDWLSRAMAFLKESSPRPTAVICCDEKHARMLAEALPGAAVRVPEDISIISFDSTETSMRTHPALTSIWQPLREIGSVGVDVLVDLIEERYAGDKQRILPVRLDVRESTTAPATR